jgi:hypothetical protein
LFLASTNETYRILCDIRDKKGRTEIGVDLPLLDPDFFELEGYSYMLPDVQYLIDHKYIILSDLYVLQSPASPSRKTSFHRARIDKPGLDFIEEHERKIKSEIIFPQRAILISVLSIILSIISIIIAIIAIVSAR